MSQIQTDNPLQSAAQAPALKPATNRFAELATEDFIKIIFTELTNQDPFQPNDSAALLDQLNSIRSIESDIELTKRLSSLVNENQLSSASNMLGSYVTGRTQDNNRVSGVAVGVAREGDTVLVQLDNGFRVPVSNIETILGLLPAPDEPDAAPAANPSPAATS